MTMKIGDVSIGREERPFIIAEMSGNHNQSLQRALSLVRVAASAGVQMVKLQTYTAETITLDVNRDEFFISDEHSPWKGSSLKELYQLAYTPWEWHEPIMKLATELGMLCISTPFDESAVDFLEELKVPAYKIASFENADVPLIRKVAATGKPIILSTGMATLAELDESVEIIRSTDNEQFALLKCTSSYPASPENSNILTIPHLREMFSCEVGLSDHTMGIGAAVAAVAHGATIVEKHFTLNRSEGGVDSTFSLEPDELKQLVIETERAWQSLGKIQYGPVESERSSLKFRRSLYFAEDLNAGDILTRDNLRSVRPGMGLQPKYYELLLGKKIRTNVKKGTPVSWDLLL